MATSTSFLIFITVFLLACIYSGLALKCYTCSSEFNGSCDNFNRAHGVVENCTESKLVKAFPFDGDTYVCVIHRMAQKDSPQLNVVRGCVPNNYCKNAAFTGSRECTACDTDLCNSSSVTVPSIVLSIISVICAKLYF